MKDAYNPLYKREQLVALARELGVRRDWHEPDEQSITCRVEGTPLNFDNAMGPGHWYGVWRPGEPPQAELHAILSYSEVEEGRARRGRDIATVNLATLFAWASEDDAAYWRRRAEAAEGKLKRLTNYINSLGDAE